VLMLVQVFLLVTLFMVVVVCYKFKYIIMIVASNLRFDFSRTVFFNVFVDFSRKRQHMKGKSKGSA
jgi:hypothetical protein